MLPSHKHSTGRNSFKNFVDYKSNVEEIASLLIELLNRHLKSFEDTKCMTLIFEEKYKNIG